MILLWTNSLIRRKKLKMKLKIPKIIKKGQKSKKVEI